MDTLALRVAARYIAGHAQTFVKVNAPVDEGIASVVEALNLIPRVHTIASCQGNDETHEAIVFLRFCHRTEDRSEDRPLRYAQIDFYCWFHRELFKRIPPENHKLIVSGVVGTDEVEFTLTFDNRITDKLANAIHEIVAYLSAGRP